MVLNQTSVNKLAQSSTSRPGYIFYIVDPQISNKFLGISHKCIDLIRKGDAIEESIVL